MTLPEQSPVVCFLDESATDAKDSNYAVVGGILLNRIDLPAFNASWHDMVNYYRMPSGLHMRDLGPSGPYPEVVGDVCVAMLTEAVSLINQVRIFTFAATSNNRHHEQLFSQKLREEAFSVYGLAFLMAVEINRASAARAKYDGAVDFVFDDGNKFKRHLIALHASICKQNLAEGRVGSLEFETDTDIPALQAADVIAWATRRKKAGTPFKTVHEPLMALFDKSYTESPMPDDVAKQMSDSFAQMEAGLGRDT